MIQQLQEENKQLRNILEAAASESPPVEQIAPQIPPVIFDPVKPKAPPRPGKRFTPPVTNPTRPSKIPSWLARGARRGLGVLGGIGGVMTAAEIGYGTGTWINDTFIDPYYYPPKPRDDQLRPMPDEVLQSPEDLYPSPTRMPTGRRRNGNGGGGGGGGMMGG